MRLINSIISNTRYKRHAFYFIGGILLILAIFVRIWGLDQYPAGLWFDEGINGLDGWLTALEGPQSFYYRHGNAREPLYIYWIALLFRFLPPTVLTLRLSSALLGLFSAAVFYPLARRFFSPFQAFVTLIFFLFFRWNFHFARLAFRTQIFSFLFLLSILTFVIYIDKKEYKYLIFTSVLHGLTFYTYLSSRLVPFFSLAVILLLYRKDIRTGCLNCLKYIIIYIIIALPLLLFFYNNPEFLFYRVQEVSILSTAQSPVIEAGANFIRSLGAFIWTGDTVVQHNYNNMPIFFFPFNLLFIYGIYIILRKRDIKYCQLVIWLFMAVSISTLSTNAPNILRMSFFSPLSVIILCTGIFHLLSKAGKYISIFYVKTTLVLLIILFISLNTVIYYAWASHSNTKAHFNYDTYALAENIEHFSARQTVWIPEIIFQHPTFQFRMLSIPENRQHNIVPYDHNNIENIEFTEAGFIIMLLPDRPYQYFSEQRILDRYPLISVTDAHWGEIVRIRKEIPDE